jgi:hypothetical protein
MTFWISMVFVVISLLPGEDHECLRLTSLAGLRDSVGGDRAGLTVESLGERGPGGVSPKITAEQWLCGPMWWGLACSAGYSFTILWCGEAFHELGVQSADVSALPCVLPQPSVSPAPQQSPWFTELRRSAAVSQSPSWISPCFILLDHIFICIHNIGYSHI